MRQYLVILFLFSDTSKSTNSCRNGKEDKRNVKSAIRRMKKQLFGVQKKRRKSRRHKRSLFPSLFNVDWMFGQSEGKSRKREEENTKAPTQQFKVNTLLEIASKRVKNVPSDFFQVVTASSMELSQFSGQQTATSVNSSQALHSQVDENSEKKQRKRNYKRRKSLFNSVSSLSWSGSLLSDTGRICPAYLVTPGHALTSCACVLTSNTASLTVIFSVYRVAVTRVTLHCGMSDDSDTDLALVTLHTPLPHSVTPLCLSPYRTVARHSETLCHTGNSRHTVTLRTVRSKRCPHMDGSHMYCARAKEKVRQMVMYKCWMKLLRLSETKMPSCKA